MEFCEGTVLYKNAKVTQTNPRHAPLDDANITPRKEAPRKVAKRQQMGLVYRGLVQKSLVTGPLVAQR